QFQLLLAVLVDADTVHPVSVSRNKIQGHVVLASEVNRFGNPGTTGRCWTTHPVIRRHVLNGFRGGFVQFEILSLIAGPEDAEVRFIPNFKVPLSHFFFTVTCGPVLHQGLNHLPPLIVVLRRRDVALPPEDSLVSTGQGGRHETKLHKRSHANLENCVIKRIHVVKVIDSSTLFVFAINCHLVLQQAVESDVLEAALAMHNREIPLPIRSQSFSGSTSAHHAAKEVVVRSLDSRVVSANHPRRWALRPDLHSSAEKDSDN